MVDKKFPVLGVVVLLALITGTMMFPDLGNPRTMEGEVVTVTDMAGRKVEVPEDVDKIVGLEAGTLRVITYLDCTDIVVGVEEIERKQEYQTGRPYILAHPELSSLPSIGPMHGGDPELIAGQDPDVILWSDVPRGDADDLQRRTGIPVIALRYGDLGTHREAVYQGLRLMGKVLDKGDRAEKVIQYLQATIQDLEDRTEDIPSNEKQKVYVGGVCYRGAHGIAGTEPRYAPFQFVNAENVAEDLGLEHVMVSEEKILEWNPDFLFVDEGSYSMVINDLKEAEFKTLQAVQNGEIYGTLPQSYYHHNFGTVLADSYYIGKILYPTRFSDVDPATKADEIYQELVGKPVYDDMKADFGGFQKIEPPK